MAKTTWTYTDADGNRVDEEFTDVQAANDGVLLKNFQALESEVAAGRDPNKTSAEQVAAVFALVENLPTQRGLHHLAEFERIGLVKNPAVSGASVATPVVTIEPVAPAVDDDPI